jgi:hypothetical protein
MPGAGLKEADVKELLRLAQKVMEDAEANESGKALAQKVNDLLAPKPDAGIKSGLAPQQTGPNLDPKSSQGRKNLRSRG